MTTVSMMRSCRGLDFRDTENQTPRRERILTEFAVRKVCLTT